MTPLIRNMYCLWLGVSFKYVGMTTKELLIVGGGTILLIEVARMIDEIKKDKL